MTNTLAPARRLPVSWLMSVAAATAVAQSPAPPTDAATMFRTLDADGSGMLTVGEGGPGIQQAIRRLFDMAGKPASGGVSIEEFREIHDRHRRQSRATPPSGPEPRPGRPDSQPQPTRSPRPAARAESAEAAARLQGTWQGWVVDGRGENPNTGHMQMELRIEGQRMVAREIGTSRAPGGLGDGTFVVGGTGDSGTLDAVATSGQHPGKEYPGIFELEGDTLRWCVNNHNRQAQRPAAFETGRGCYYMVLHRQTATDR
jgi:uncharacterized protein (TIGR03067 family)